MDQAGLKRTPGGRTRVHGLPLVALALLVTLTAALAVFAHVVVGDQESRLLVERANEVNLVLTDSISSTETELGLVAAAAQQNGVAGFTLEAQQALDSSGGGTSTGLALVRYGAGGLSVVAATGAAPPVGSPLPPPAAAALEAVNAEAPLAATDIYRAGGERTYGVAYWAGPSLAVFRQSRLGLIQPPRGAGTAPFSELRVVIYASATPQPAQVIAATTAHLPLSGSVRYVPFAFGSTRWLVGVEAVQPLVGSAAASMQWVALGAGLIVSLLVFATFEVMARRRDEAEMALAQEHDFAETLQRRLLPVLPDLPGVDVAFRYVTASDRQAVGGDWFDAFLLPSDQVGVVIGDVMGHDVEAAATMAQIRAALRGFASETTDPQRVVERLAAYMEAFAVPAIVTVIYGVLHRPDTGGARRFTWANAGHLPPLVLEPGGAVTELTEGSSPLLGAPSVVRRDTGQCHLAAGSSLVLYTDGLVEIPGRDLGASIEEVKATLAGMGSASAWEICDALLGSQLPARRRDDVALLVLTVGADPAAEPGGGQAPGTTFSTGPGASPAPAL